MTIADELKTTFLFEHLSDEQLAWLAERSVEERHPAGTMLYTEGEPAVALWILLDGEIQLTKRVGGEDVVLGRTDQRGVYAGAVRAFVRSYAEENYSNNARLLRDSRLVRIPSEVFTQLLEEHFPMAQHLLDGLFLGVRNMEAMIRQREKLVALGALSAGLAHELNNPAAGARRAAGALRAGVGDLRAGLARLGEAGATAEVLGRVAALAGEAAELARAAEPLDTVASSDREDELGAWLEGRDVDDPWRLAPALVDAGLDVAFLERLEEAAGPAAFGAALSWVVASLAVTALVDNVEDATARMSSLVAAVKDYTYMDQAAEQEVDVHDGLESTLTMLTHKLKKGVTVERHYDRSLPRVRVYGSELNQVWTNLLDNAVDAMGGQGTVTITTARDGDCLRVEIADEGAGIPEAIQPRVFEPFFTTKDVGKGTGLGLDISYRIVNDRHRGSLTFTSRPGDTRFTVRIPLAGVQPV